MKKKVTKILSALTAIVLTVLSVMMVMPVEAKAEDSVPFFRLESSGGWSEWDDTDHEFKSLSSSQFSGSFTADLSSPSNDVVNVTHANGSECPIVHFPDGSKYVFAENTSAVHFPAAYFSASPIKYSLVGADLYLWNIPTVTYNGDSSWDNASGSTVVYPISGTWLNLNNATSTPSSTPIKICVNGEEVQTFTSNSLGITLDFLVMYFPLYSGLTEMLSWETYDNVINFSATVINDPQPSLGESSGKSNAHVHNFQWQTITEPTKDADGLEGEVCSCGAIRNTQPISAFAYALYQYAIPMINAAKPGQTITFEFGEFNSFPKAFMEKLVEKNGQNVTFVFHYKWNHVKQEITIPAGNPIDLNFDWYGPAKMAELYGAN